ncbi:MAG: ATP-dependent Clp protease adaptor ClpS [Bacteroidales bacterium]|nr:ATP-dependent Clp protease adaptor ClpS [Bacteroidales bacterium]
MAKQQSHIKDKNEVKNEYPKMYKVIMHNDDFTTMEFVVEVLRTVFRKDESQAEQLMMKVHKEGQAVVGVYTLDMAITKRDKAMRMAREQEFPFRMTVEPEEESI